MGIFRSVTMSHGTLVIPQERARDCIDLLCRNTNIQFVDMNERRLDRPYKKYIQRILNMERMIRVLTEEVTSLPGTMIVKDRIDDFLRYDKVYRLDQVEESLVKLYEQFEKFKQNDLMLKTELEEVMNEYSVMLVALKQLNASKKQGFLPTDTRVQKSSGMDESAESNAQLLSESDENGEVLDTEMVNISPSPESDSSGSTLAFSNIAGVISAEDKDAFSRAIFRAMRGNVYTFFQDSQVIKEAILSRGLITEEEASIRGNEEKIVFVIYCQSASGSSTFQKLQKLCNGFQAKTFAWSKSHSHINQRLQELEEIIRDRQKALNAFKRYFREEIACLLECPRPDGNSVIEEWSLFCRKEKYIYYILNHFEGSDITLRADCWFPEEEEETIRTCLQAEKSEGRVSALLLIDHQFKERRYFDDPATMPPTYNKNDVFTSAFQGVVDTYGVPRYKEMNPTPFTIVTFPFLFGIMFGDIGHGMCVILAGLFLIIRYPQLRKKYNDEMALMILNGRYMILLMGIFATYTGFIYNDFLSLPNNFFGSCWVRERAALAHGAAAAGEVTETLVKSTESFPVSFGLDVAWIHAVNEQPMLHSFKMKLSIIVGFLQMMMGILLKGMNAIYFRQPLDFFFEFIPQLVLMCCFVGYITFLIFYKWLTPVTADYPKPSIIITLIDMCLFKELAEHDVMYPGQRHVQKVLVSMMMLCIPLMLLPKPLYMWYQQRRRIVIGDDHPKDHEMVYRGYDDVENNVSEIANAEIIDREENAVETSPFKRVATDSTRYEGEFAVTIHNDGTISEDHSGGHSMTDIFIHQLIETIEFSLGIISNTASYLRLWALSLSHQQLSAVFFNQTVLRTLSGESGVVGTTISLFFTSTLFAVITAAVMLGMDTLECYLHAMRLQWVEFQNKFYKADGKPFKPFNVKVLLENPETEQ
ncbi:V-type ATPase 116kDa subunit family protein [Babesia bovis T2Bo]|uniref:V-type proton ATPase subunit a n=1 Tax=Babesia bovis TaxID=5865 RepID=A7APA6_BABBO|nr:V-type ATPase 116kDa subunit family protein [Babesia bovis T2Bo]EDO08390.1 V-type ATPase 116kDa subunit family protein [Babesia bovis T2Bo]|eukprot:XP_001611958.1 V-type ATPase 116kDa subunit family protein [Babesia bovis T2Bo]